MKYQTPSNLANLNKHLKTQQLTMMKDSICDLPAGQTKIDKRQHSVIVKDKTSSPPQQGSIK